MDIIHGYPPWMDIIHGYHPWISSMDISHGYHPWIFILHGYHPWMDGPKPTEHRSINGVQDGWHLSIDLICVLVDFGRQVGRDNGAEIDSKRYRKKNDAKKRGGRRDCQKSRNKKLQPRHIQTEGLGPWGGRGEGPARVDPSPHSDSGIILHGYHPWISSMDIIHGYLSSMDIIHGWRSSMDIIHGY